MSFTIKEYNTPPDDGLGGTRPKPLRGSWETTKYTTMEENI